MPRPNPFRQLVRAAVRQVAGGRPALEQNVPARDETGATTSGHTESTTGDWQPAGISNLTSTADPFYSAAG